VVETKSLDDVILIDLYPVNLRFGEENNWFRHLKPVTKFQDVDEELIYLVLSYAILTIDYFLKPNTYTTKEIFKSKIKYFEEIVSNKLDRLLKYQKEEKHLKIRIKRFKELVQKYQEISDMASTKIYELNNQQEIYLLEPLVTNVAISIFEEKQKKFSDAPISLVLIALIREINEKKTIIKTNDTSVLDIYLETKRKMVLERNTHLSKNFLNQDDSPKNNLVTIQEVQKKDTYTKLGLTNKELYFLLKK